MISFAQIREDVLLHRVLHHVPHEQGFYIDVGAYHPTIDSVTKHFYDHGWRGINIEASPELFAPFPIERPRDINLQVAVSDNDRDITFFDVEGQLSTVESRFAELHSTQGRSVQSYTVPGATLAAICQAHAPRDIHFLKIDIEGHEAAAIRGMDFRRHRPWLLVIESTEPNNWLAATYREWDGRVRASGYQFAYTDVLNRYYVADEHQALLRLLLNPVDDYVPHGLVHRITELETALRQAEQDLAMFQDQAIAKQRRRSFWPWRH